MYTIHIYGQLILVHHILLVLVLFPINNMSGRISKGRHHRLISVPEGLH